MRKISLHDLEILELQLAAASPSEVAGLVKKLTKARKRFFADSK